MIYDSTPKHNVTNAVVYCRVSSKAQTKRGDGLNSQKTRCNQYAKYKGYDVLKVFTDDLTGKRIDRPGLQAMLSYLQSDRKNPHVVIVDDLTRFARKVSVHFELREAITKAGGILESPSVELRDDADGELHEYILASVSQHQSRKNAEQTLNRMKARLSNGYWVFQPPIGFKYEKLEGHGKVLVRNEPIASIVQEALEGYASGRLDTQAEVKRFLERQPDFPKDLPGGLIRNQRVTLILNRSTYAGYVESENWAISLRKGQHEGIIDLTTYQKIQDRLKGGARVPARKDIRDDFPLRGFVVCGDCGKPLTSCWSKGGAGKKHPYYLCFNRDCASNRKSIPRDKLEGEFAGLLKRLQPSQKLFDITQAMFRKAWDIRLGQASLHKVSIQKEIVNVEKQIEQLVDRVVDCQSMTTVSAYEKRIAKFEKEKLILAEKLEIEDDPKHTFDEMFERALGFLASPCNLWKSDRIEDKKTVLKLSFSERLAYCRANGFRTPQVSVPFKFFDDFKRENEMAHPARFERATSAFGGQV